jgi:hypothetical protein
MRLGRRSRRSSSRIGSYFGAFPTRLCWWVGVVAGVAKRLSNMPATQIRMMA